MNKGYFFLIACIAVGATAALFPISQHDESVAAEAVSPPKTSDSASPLPLNPSSELSDANGDQAALTGRVVESIQVPEYTYLRVEGGDGVSHWAAIPSAEVVEGSQVTIEVDTKMVSFNSPSLNRTFSTIRFGTLAATGGHAAPNPHGAKTGSPHVQAGSALPEVGRIAKASGPGGVSIEELFASKARLKGTQVRVRGVVVKSSKAMGKTFAHLRDGTGSEQRADHDLTVTLADALTVGDEVTIAGNVTVDRDFGQGYRYDVIIEDATLVRE